MLQTAFDKNTSQIIIRGDFFELDRIYFMIERLSGNYGIGSTCLLNGYEQAASILQALNYEIRHAQQGDRELYVSYNGLNERWIAPTGTPAAQISKEEDQHDPDKIIEEFADSILIDMDINLDEFYDMDEYDQREVLADLNLSADEAEIFFTWLNRKPTWYFSSEEYPGASEKNTLLQFRLPFAEALLHALILRELLSLKTSFMEKSIAQAKENKYSMGGYELLFCRRRMPSELLLLEQLMEEIFSAIYDAIGDENYDSFQNALPPIGSFHGMRKMDVKKAERAVVQTPSANFDSTVSFMKNLRSY